MAGLKLGAGGEFAFAPLNVGADGAGKGGLAAAKRRATHLTEGNGLG